MSELRDLQAWYLSQCNEDWEHTYGVEIGTLDNPGWSIKIDLYDTCLDGVEYSNHSYGVGPEADPEGNDWVITKVENGQFVGYGGPEKLSELISLFLGWAKENA